MTLYNINGKLVTKNVSKYRIGWDDKSCSKIQTAIKLFLKPYWLGHIVYEEFPVYGTKLRVDILNATLRIAVEVDGEQHSSYNPFFHGSRSGYLASIKRDMQKRQWLEQNEFRIIIIGEKEVKDVDETWIKEKYDIDL